MEPASHATPRWASIFTVRYWREWFTRPCGGREVFNLAIPIIISSATFGLMMFADRIYLTWYDQRGMTAAYQAGSLLWALITFPVGIAAFTNAFVSQYNGAKRYRRIGLNVWQGIFFGLGAGLLFLAATPLIEPLFLRLNAPPDLAKLERDYWFYISLGASATVAHEPLTAYFCGRRDMKTVMWIGIASVAANIILDPILIFGIDGKLRFGVTGAAIASAISLWFKFGVYLVVALNRDRKWRCGLLDQCRFHWGEMKRLLRFGSMSGVQALIENSCYTLFILLMGWFGEEASAASAIAFNLNVLAFMPMAGIGGATTALVGNQVGARRPDLASRATRTALVYGMAFTGVFMLAFLLVPTFFLNLYAHKNPEEFEKIRDLAIVSLRFVAVYLFFDSANVVFASALRGAGDARFIMCAAIAGVGIALLFLFGGVIMFERGVMWSWTILTVYIYLNASILGARFVLGGWKTKSLVRNAEST